MTKKRLTKNFSELYTEISQLSKLDPCDHSEKMCKLTEEVGELATAINRMTGRKHRKKKSSIFGKEGIMTVQEILANIVEETADVIQCAICVADGFGITAEQVMESMTHKNESYAKGISERIKKPITLK